MGDENCLEIYECPFRYTKIDHHPVRLNTCAAKSAIAGACTGTSTEAPESNPEVL